VDRPSWQERVTASIDDAEGRTIVAEGAFGEIVIRLCARYPEPQCRRILLAFPDRLAPPYRIDGVQIGALAEAFEKQKLTDMLQGCLNRRPVR
jgi:hypothetical protein